MRTFRTSLLKRSPQTATEERVEVNQRALVDKVLARYSGEFTLFRELLQNADDAGASNAEIRFGTAVHQRPLKRDRVQPFTSDSEFSGAQVIQWSFRNNGKEFDDADWNRLPRIAEGNPNPEKIGAFGVGFYSVFSVTDSPCVSSGKYELRFYWKNDNQLYTRRRTLPQPIHWTTFILPLREPGPMLSVSDLMRFLATSMAFMAKLTVVGVFLDDKDIGYIKRSHELPRAIDVPRDLKRSSPKGIMYVKDVCSHRTMIEAEVRRAASTGKTRDSTLTEVLKLRVVLTIFTAEVDVTADERLEKELYRCMKKSPPVQLKYSLIYTGKDDCIRNSMKSQNIHPVLSRIFEGLDADLEGAKHTRIFIGHATGQTTSIGGHMASRFIPTVEREAIDFVDQHVSIWNKELLYVGGFLCRVVYELELVDIKLLWERADKGVPGSNPLDDLHLRFLHLLKFFAFQNSTPSQNVAYTLHKSFYDCSALALRLLSSIGVCAASDIRAFDPRVCKFLDCIPMLPEHVSREAAHHINGLPDPYRISSVTTTDVLQALDGHPLEEDKLVSCLQWWLELKKNGPDLLTIDLLNAITLYKSSGTLSPLSWMKYFVNIDGLGIHIPRDGPLPMSVIPLGVSMHFSSADLMSLGWRELPIIDWFQHASRADVRLGNSMYDFTKSPGWAGLVLNALSRAWSSLSEEEHHKVKAILENMPCIPTSHNLHYPNESYLPSGNDALIHKFGLPVVTVPGFTLDKETKSLLVFIGAQIHVPLELLTDQLLGTGEWTISDLTDYLVRLNPPLTMQQLSMLQSCKIFSKEYSEIDDGKRSLYCACELYPPVEVFRRLRLPVIDWNQLNWSDDSAAAKLLYRLGLCPYPSLQEMINLCASPDSSIREIAFVYLCNNLASRYAENKLEIFYDIAFIPAENKKGICLRRIGDVYLGAQWITLGFSVVRSAYRKMIVNEFSIRHDPLPSDLIDLLERTPPSYEEARDWYEHLSEHVQTFTQSQLESVSKLKIVPRSPPNTGEWLTPKECYLGEPTNEFYSKLFTFVDFGTKASQFLSACGSMKEPSAKDVAESLINDPDRFYELSGTHERFLDILRDLAAQKAYIPNDTLSRMSLQRTLLGRRQERTSHADNWKAVYDLRTPEEIVIVDDPRDYELFGDIIHVAPRDELLERFYTSIGCRPLSAVIHECYESSPARADKDVCYEIRALILARLDSFLKKCSHYQYDQLPTLGTKNFSVAVCERLLVHKTLVIGHHNISRRQDLWAVPKCNKDGSIELWLSRCAKRDMYDLAASLCRILFGLVKDTDTFLLAAMLSSDPELMKRAGFDGDQCSKPRLSTSESLGDFPTGHYNESTVHDYHSSANHTVNQDSPQLVRGLIVDTINTACTSAYRSITKLVPSLRTSVTSMTSEAEFTPRQTIPQNYIRDIVNKATLACGSGKNQFLDDEDKMVQFLRRYFCDHSVDIDNFRSLGITPQGIEIHVAGGISDICAFISGKQELLARFVRIIEPAAFAHKLPINVLHIFYDIGKGPIAFNLEGSIYFNLRYFEEWHDEDVKSGHSQRAKLSWFFVLAHEIAHSLIPLHDSAHEFWFSAICEDHIGDLFAHSRFLTD